MYKHGLYYGGYNNDSEIIDYATILDINAKIKTENTVSSGRGELASASVCGNGFFHGGTYGDKATCNTLAIINNNAILIKKETYEDFPRQNHAGASINNDVGVFYNGNTYLCYINSAIVLDSNGKLLHKNNSVGTERHDLSGASFKVSALFYGGISCIKEYNTATILDKNANLVANEIDVGNPVFGLAGTSIDNNGIFYGGYKNKNSVTILDKNANLLLIKNNIGTGRHMPGSATVECYAMFYGGSNNDNAVNTVTVLSKYGDIINNETNIGIKRYALAGASV